MPRREREGFVWVPYIRSTRWDCLINGISVHDYILSGSFPMGLITEELVCEIELENSGEQFTGVFSAGHEIEFKMDFNNGSTTQFKGILEEIKSKHEGGFFKLSIKGSHFTSLMTDITVSEEFTNASIASIKQSLIDNYFT